MIHHLGHLVRRGEMTITESNQVEGWLQLYGQETLIRYELESNQDTPLVGCRITFEPELVEDGETELPSEIQAIQFGDLISLMIREVEPPMFDHTNIDLKVDGTYRCSLQLVWESHDGIIDVAIAPAQIDVQWNDAELRQSDTIPESILPVKYRETINQRLEQIDKAYSEDNGEYLISVKIPSDAQLENLAEFQIQTMVHKVEEGPKHRMIEFMKETSTQEKNIPICDLLEPPIKTPLVEDMSRDQLQDKVLEILGRLSVLGVEFKRCEHFDNAKLYDWLIHKVIPWERVHPELQQFQMTRFFDTSLWCDDCGIYQSL